MSFDCSKAKNLGCETFISDMSLGVLMRETSKIPVLEWN